MIFEQTKTVYDLMANAEREHGVRTFLKYEEQDTVFTVTYGEFARECAAIAAWAEDQEKLLGLERRIRVGLLGSSSHRYLNVLLGVMSGGGVAVPLDIQMNAQTLADCLNRSDVDILFYDWDFHVLVKEVEALCFGVKQMISFQRGRQIVCADALLEEYDGKRGGNRAVPDDCALVLFTSGTTGRGKGVMLSHANLMDNTFCTTDLEHPEQEIYLGVLPIHHVFCINGDVFIVIRYGSTLCLNRDMKKLAEHILLFQPTVIRMVPMIAKALYNKIAIKSRQTPGRSMRQVKEEVLGSRLHKIISGGGYLAPELAQNYQRLGISIAQGYGMSECSPKVSSPDWSRPDKVASVGKIVDRCQVRIVDGEIQVKSPSVMMGYYGEPEKTAEAITEDGWLRTGDIGYVDEENFLYLTGRKKNLIILSNGENVAPEQLENLFEDERLIEDILVYGEDDMICAEAYPNYPYAEAANIEDIPATVDSIIRRHNQELPSFKRILKCRIREVPFQKTSSKKIIRGQYFTDKKQEEQAKERFVKPGSELENMLYESVAAVLGHERFGVDTDLYEVGLDSMGSVMLLSELYQKLGMSLTLEDLMANATVQGLVRFCKQQPQETDYAYRTVYPLTNLQMYFAYVLRGNTTANLPFLYELDRRVDLRRLKWAVERLFDLHPELKDVVQFDGTRFQNFRDDGRKATISIIHLTDAEWEAVRQELLRPYGYTQGEPLYHMGLYETESANYFFFDIAHIMGDGVSMNVLFEDLNALYEGHAVAPQDYTFYEYILDEGRRDEQGMRAQNLRYFSGLMEGVKIDRSILVRHDCAIPVEGENAALRGRFSNLSRSRVQAFCHKYGVSENVLFLTAYNYCIGIYSNQADTVSSSVHSGRTDSRWSRLVGPLFKTYYFRYTEHSEETVAQMLKRSGRQIMESMRCYVSNLHADEMFFQYQGDILNMDAIGGYPAKRQRIQLDSLPFHLQVFSDAKGYFYELRYWKNRFDSKLLALFMKSVEAVVAAMLEETWASRLKRCLPEELYPKHLVKRVWDLHWETKKMFLPNLSGDMEIKPYVFDDDCRKKPFGAWGTLYIKDYRPVDCIDQIANPYGDGVLYQTKETARILPDGKLEILEKGSRVVMMETLTGRRFLDLDRLEKVLLSYPGVKAARAYVCYGEKNQMELEAEIMGNMEPDQTKLDTYLEWNCEKVLIPARIKMIFDAEAENK